MTVCPTCGEDLNDDATACTICRHELPAWVTRPAVQLTQVGGRDLFGRALSLLAWTGLVVVTSLMIGCWSIPSSHR